MVCWGGVGWLARYTPRFASVYHSHRIILNVEVVPAKTIWIHLAVFISAGQQGIQFLYLKKMMKSSKLRIYYCKTFKQPSNCGIFLGGADPSPMMFGSKSPSIPRMLHHRTLSHPKKKNVTPNLKLCPKKGKDTIGWKFLEIPNWNWNPPKPLLTGRGMDRWWRGKDRGHSRDLKLSGASMMRATAATKI